MLFTVYSSGFDYRKLRISGKIPIWLIGPKRKKSLKYEENPKGIKEILVNEKAQRAEVFNHCSWFVFREKRVMYSYNEKMIKYFLMLSSLRTVEDVIAKLVTI